MAAHIRDDNKAPTRRMRDWSPTVELLTAVLNRLGELVQAVAALGGASPRQLPPAPHPVTAVDRVKTRNRKAKHAALVARVLPHHAP
jgi:hypothetical protein